MRQFHKVRTPELKRLDHYAEAAKTIEVSSDQLTVYQRDRDGEIKRAKGAGLKKPHIVGSLDCIEPVMVSFMAHRFGVIISVVGAICPGLQSVLAEALLLEERAKLSNSTWQFVYLFMVTEYESVPARQRVKLLCKSDNVFFYNRAWQYVKTADDH